MLTKTEYRLEQVLERHGFRRSETIPMRWETPDGKMVAGMKYEEVTVERVWKTDGGRGVRLQLVVKTAYPSELEAVLGDPCGHDGQEPDWSGGSGGGRRRRRR